MEQVYSPAQPTPVKKEKVTLPDGRFLYVWGSTTANYIGIRARAARHPADPRGGTDDGIATLGLIAASCYNSDEPGAARIFSDLDLDKVGALTVAEMTEILLAIGRVNGGGEQEQQEIRDFLAVTPGANGSPSTSSASSTSAASLVK